MWEVREYSSSAHQRADPHPGAGSLSRRRRRRLQMGRASCPAWPTHQQRRQGAAPAAGSCRLRHRRGSPHQQRAGLVQPLPRPLAATLELQRRHLCSSRKHHSTSLAQGLQQRRLPCLRLQHEQKQPPLLPQQRRAGPPLIDADHRWAGACSTSTSKSLACKNPG